MNRRGFLKGMAGILASGVAPAVVGSGILMPVRTIVRPTPLELNMICTNMPGIPIGMVQLMEWSQEEMNRLCGVSMEMLALRRRSDWDFFAGTKWLS